MISFELWKPGDKEILDKEIEPSWTITASNPALAVLLRRYARMLEHDGADWWTARDVRRFASQCFSWNRLHGSGLPIDDPLPTIVKGQLTTEKP